MKDKLIAREVQCFRDLIALAFDSVEIGRTDYAIKMLEDSIKSLKEIESLRKNETVVLIGTFMPSRNSNDI